MGRYSLILTLLFLSLSSNLIGDPRDLSWYEGTVIFKNDRQMVGEIHIDMDLGLLLIKDPGGIKSFPAFKVKYMEYFDEVLGRSRSFITVPNRALRFHRSANIFELVITGELKVLRKEIETYDGFKRNKSVRMPEFGKSGEEQFTYFLYDGNTLTKFNWLTKKRIATLVQKYSSEVADYVKQYKMNLKDTISRIKVIAYYNAIHQCREEGGEC